MLSFFRFNDPYRLVFVFLILLIIRLPVLLSDDALSHSDLHYMVIGEKMDEGAMLYIELWDNIAPLAAGVYWIIDALFGRSLLAYQIISLLLITIQAAIFNRLLLNNKAFNENSYAPALIYVICASLFFDFFTLTPILMSITFLLMALDRLFDHMEIRAKRDEQIFSIGLQIGVAALFYLPVIIIAPAILLILAFFTGTVFRRYILLSFGVTLPFLLLIAYYLLKDGVRDLYYSFFNPWMVIDAESLMDFSGLAIILAVPAIYLLLGFGKVMQGLRFTNYQLRLTQAMFIWLLFSVVIMFFGTKLAPAKFMLLVPPLAFYISHYFLSMRKNLKSEIIFAFFFVPVLLVSLGTYFDFFFTKNYVHYKRLLVSSTPYDEMVKGKSVLVLDENVDIYKEATLATPYFNWRLTEPLFDSPEYYDNITEIFVAFKNDPPAIVIDPHQKMEEVMKHIPWLKENYRLLEEDIYTINN
ncbi:MAG: hypothetical protein ACNS60_06910 [Candidatus Cyclobacteriaceae bacterium M2_1C_046]